MNYYEYVFKYIVVGDVATGKTCLLHQFTEKKFIPNCPHTIGVEFGTRICEVNNANIKLQIWDTAGQERYRSVTRSFYRGAAGALLVYDITRRATYNRISSWLEDARRNTNPNTVMLLIGNKLDLADKEREVTFEEAQKFASENGLLFLETSAKTGENVEEAFLQTARAIYDHIQQGLVDLSSKTSGVQHTPQSAVGLTNPSNPPAQSSSCGC